MSGSDRKASSMRIHLLAVPLVLVGSLSACWAQSATTKAADPLGPVRTHLAKPQPNVVRHVYRLAGKPAAAPFVLGRVTYTPWHVPGRPNAPRKIPKNKQ